MDGGELLLDGAEGEGDGQVLRTALALALVTGRPFHLVNARARRPRPGLQRQHVTAALAAARVGRAEVRGAEPGSRELRFVPGELLPGDHELSVGTAGSATLVLQTLLPALLGARAPSRVRIEGGTHNPLAPPFEFFARSFLPLVARMGARAGAALLRPGFYPAGGGAVELRVEPGPPLAPLALDARGAIRRRRAPALVSRLPLHVAERELAVVRDALGWEGEELEPVEVRDARGPGNVLLLEVEAEHVTAVFAGFGERGRPAEAVAAAAVAEARRWLDADVPVGEHLADQLLVPLALAGGGRFTTTAPSLHTTTNAGVVARFLPVEFAFAEGAAGRFTVEARPRPPGKMAPA